MSTTTEQATDALVATRYAGNARIELRSYPTHYAVITTYASTAQEIPGFIAAYPTLAEAKAEAERARKLFREYGTDVAIEARRVELTWAIDALMKVRRMSTDQRRRFNALNAEADSLDTLATRQQHDQLTTLNAA